MLNFQTVARTEPLASLLKDKGHVFQPGYYELNESNVRAFIKKAMSTEFHPCGTCAMSPRHKGVVVDERLRAYGTGRKTSGWLMRAFSLCMFGRTVSCQILLGFHRFCHVCAEKGKDKY